MLDRSLAERAFQRVARVLGHGDIVRRSPMLRFRIAVAKMAGAVREVSVHRGFDPRDFTLVGFGGAGPMHIFHVAEELAIPRVMIPRFPGHLSALGQMLADLRRDFGHRLGRSAARDRAARAPGAHRAMQADAEQLLASDGVERSRQSHAFRLDMRYAGQSFTLPIRWNPGDGSWTPAREAFDFCHEETFGYAAADERRGNRQRPAGVAGTRRQAALRSPRTRRDPLIERRACGSRLVRVPGIRRDAMQPGSTLTGPAIVEEAGGTSVVPPGWTVNVDASGALICTAPRA